MSAISEKLSYFHRFPIRGILTAIAVGIVLVAASPGLAADGIILGGKSKPSGPTTAELADRAQAAREKLEKQAAEMAARETQLREKAATEAAAARTSCPELIAMKYPWVTCETNEYGRKEIRVPGTGSALGVVPMMSTRNDS